MIDFFNILDRIAEDLEAIEHMVDCGVQHETLSTDIVQQADTDIVQQADTDITAWIATVDPDREIVMKSCVDCGMKFRHVSSYNRHRREAKRCMALRRSRGEVIDSKEFVCEHCQRTFTRLWDLTRHNSRFH